jgi:hypothetical protein
MDISMIPCNVGLVLSIFGVHDFYQKILAVCDFQRYCSTVECSLYRAVNVRFIYGMNRST